MCKLSLSICGILLLLTFSSCKETESRVNPKTGEISLTEEEKNQFQSDSPISKGVRIIKNMRDKITPAMIEKKVVEAQGILEYRMKEIGTKSWPIFTTNYWEYEYIFGGAEMSKPGELAGRWVKFNDDLTYEYGYYQDKQGSGTYHYDQAQELLLMVDDNKQIKPSEYKVNMATNIAILIGTSVYYDNNFQCKIKGRVDIPTRPNDG